MDFQEFKEIIMKQKEYLTYDRNLAFEEVLEFAKQNRRIRNIFVFYAMADQNNFLKFKELALIDAKVGEMYANVFKALQELAGEDSPAKSFASLLLHTFFLDENPKTKATDSYKEMKKYLKTIVFRHETYKSMSDEFKSAVEKRLQEVDFDNLFETTDFKNKANRKEP